MIAFRRHIVTLALCTISLCSFAQLNTDRITAIGRNALYFEDYVLSIQYFNQVIYLKPYLSEPYFYRAIAKIQLEDYQGALRDCNAAIERNPFSPGCYYARGYIYRQLNQWKQAEDDYTEALHFSPENRTYMLLRADTRAQMKHYDEALDDIEQMLRREPQSSSVWCEKGHVTMLKKDTLGALSAYEQAVKYDKTNPAIWSAMGVTNLMLEHEEDAYVQLTQAINLGSKWAGDYINRGLLHYRRHNFRGALSDYDQAVKLAPRDAGCYYNRGIMRYEVGDYNRAQQDLHTALDLEPDKLEIRYYLGLVALQLKQWKEVVTQMDTLIAHYPYFTPAYYIAAQAKDKQGATTAAQRYRYRAYEKDNERKTMQTQPDKDEQPDTEMQIAQAQPQKKDYRKEFSASTAQKQQDVPEEEQKYDSQTRGTIQKHYQDVINEPNIVLSYYTQDLSLRRTNYYHPIVEQLNAKETVLSPIRFTGQEIALTADMVDFHFTQITRLSQAIDTQLENPQEDGATLSVLLLARAMEFAIVQDYTSAIDDCTRAIQLPGTDNPLSIILTFCRANWRYRLLEYKRATGELDATANMDFDIMLRDYDQVIRLQPDFTFAIYNKANILCAQHEWKEAIAYYTLAIEQDSQFAEAYFNRGLTFIYIGENEKGLNDLSKAGELGIYQAYNLITRFK